MKQEIKEQKSNYSGKKIAPQNFIETLKSKQGVL